MPGCFRHGNSESNDMPQTPANERLLNAIYEVIQANPGIRPRDIHRILGIEHSGYLRNILIKRQLVTKKQKGSTVYYYALKGKS
jgi:predicted transcriptional regulator